MKRIRFDVAKSMTFKDGCELYLLDCRQRNLREATINHYRQSFLRFYRYFEPDLPLEQIDETMYNGYVLQLCDELENSVSVNTYLRNLITVFHFLMEKGHVKRFRMRSIKVDKQAVETYTEEELRLLLKKPNIRRCNFTEYECWVMTNFLFSTGVRQRSLNHIQIKDVDLDNYVVYVRVTKNRKPLVLPINSTLRYILQEYMKHRQHKDKDDYLFCNAYGQQLCKSTGYKMLVAYNRGRGVQTTGIHRYRHTFAKQWVLSGGNVVTLSRILGHSSLDITQNYINLLVTDLSKQVEEINLLDKFTVQKRIKL